MGVKTVQLVEGKGQLAGARIVRDGYQVMLISDGGTVIRMPVDGIKRAGRVDAGRDRDAPARGRAGLDARAGRRLGRRRSPTSTRSSRSSRSSAERPLTDDEIADELESNGSRERDAGAHGL